MNQNATSGGGRVTRIAGPVVGCVGLDVVRLYDVVHVGNVGLIGEVIRIDGDAVTVQVYEDTTGLEVGEPVVTTGSPLSVSLGPGLLGMVYDGLQRPLTATEEPFLARGVAPAPLPRERRWTFTPLLESGVRVSPGVRLGYVPETPHLRHYVMVPPGIRGNLSKISSGEVGLDDVVATVDSGDGEVEITLRRRWPVRRPRPVRDRLDPTQPLISGMRIIDTFFPVAKGGTAIIPGGFGTGKTVAEQSLARWADVDIVVYIGCGERGNEMAEVLQEFPLLEDPRYGAPLMQRTILIANTSNMPVAAREASVYTGITMAEYYRDMGYDILLLADSTSRWAEALREISSRLEEMPGEEGYPAYLGARLASFYERAGRVPTAPWPDEQGPAHGSVTIVGAVSPPGGDFSEPMTQSSLRVAGTFWGLDSNLAHRRHFPAINWLQSYSLYRTGGWFVDHVDAEWPALTGKALAMLHEEEELQEIVQLVGPDTLAPEQQLILAVARMLREDYLQQHAYDPVDRYCPPEKAAGMLRVLLTFDEHARAALERGVRLPTIMGLPLLRDIARMKEIPVEESAARLADLVVAIPEQLAALATEEGEAVP